MAGNTSDETLPPVSSPSLGGGDASRLQLTIIFHPDSDRIGQHCVLPQGDFELALGRHTPSFHRPGQSAGASALEDRYISRAPLVMRRRGTALSLCATPGCSRLAVAGAELGSTALELPAQQLAQGVPLMLASRIVLLLRLSQPQLAAADDPDNPVLVGSSAGMSALRETARTVSRTQQDVLLRGETGTGKELVAREIHRLGPRARGPFIAVNMAAITPGLAAAELFGRARGAYTGADQSRDGFFLAAHGGCLFLDEIGDTPAEVQPQLLRALQQREIQPVGAAVRTVDVTVISATDRDLDSDGLAFDNALRHRLGGCEVMVPPLREHPEDVGELLVHFLSRHAATFTPVPPLPWEGADQYQLAAWAALFYRMVGARWPGNTRQLENAVKQVLLASSDAGLVLPAQLEAALSQSRPARYQVNALRNPAEVGERELVQAMQANQWEIARAARALRISRQGIYRRIEESPELRTAGEIPVDELRASLAHHGGALAPTASALRVSKVALRRRLRAADIHWQGK